MMTKIIIPQEIKWVVFMHCESMIEVLKELSQHQRVVSLFLKNGERFQLKIMEVRGELLIGEARGLHHNHEMGREMQRFASESGVSESPHLPQGAVGMTMADAIENFGAKAHRFRFHVDIKEISSFAEDTEDAFDETPYFGSLF